VHVSGSSIASKQLTQFGCAVLTKNRQIGRINLAESQKFSMHQFANWDQAAGFYTAHYDANTLHIAPTAATQDHPIRLFATQHILVRAPARSANPGTENHPIFIASTAGSPISVSSTASTPIAATQDAAKLQFPLKVPRGGVPVRAQSIGTPTPISRTLQPFPMPSPSPNFGKATPLPGPPVSTLPKSDAIIIPDSDDEDAIIIPDSDDEDHTHQKGKSRNVIVIGDDDDDSVLPQKPYPSSPSHPSALPSPIPATPVKGTRRFKPLFAEGYSPSDFFNADGHPDDIAASLNAQKASLRARQLEKIEKYMKAPRTDLRSATQAARTPVNSNAPSTSVLSRDDGYESDYGISDFSAAGLQELDAILDSLVNGA